MKKLPLKLGVFIVLIAVVIVGAVIVFISGRGETPGTGTQTGAGGRSTAAGTQAAGGTTGVKISTAAGKPDMESLPDDAETLLAMLREAVAEEDWEKSKALCEHLAKLGPQVIEPLRDILLDNEGMEKKEIELRWRAAYTLGLLKDKKVIPIFDEALRTEKAELVRNNIVMGLGATEAEETRPILERLLLDGAEGTTARRSAAAYLARLQTGSDALLDLLGKSGGDKDVTAWIIKALPRSKNRERAAQALEDFLTSAEDGRLRAGAAKSLGRIASESSAGILAGSLGGEQDARVRTAIAKALGNFRDIEAVRSALVDALGNDKEPTVRGAAARTLGRFANRETVAPLRETLRNETDRVVRVRIVKALGSIGGEEAEKILKDAAANDPSIHVRKAAEEILKSSNN